MKVEPDKWHEFVLDDSTFHCCKECGRLDVDPIHFRRVSHTKSVFELPPGEEFVAMVVFNGQLIVASNTGVYRLREPNKLERLEIVEIKDDGRPNAE